jgi:hydrogenase expression/formation protein HypC
MAFFFANANETFKAEEVIMCLGIPGQIVEIVDETFDIAKVEVSGIKRNISIALVRPDGIIPGDWVLVHVGFAMSKIDEQEAHDTLQALQLMGDPFKDEMEMLHTSQIE